MDVLDKVFGGWWGPLVAGAVVVLFEYLIVKPLVERSASGQSPDSDSVIIKPGKRSKNRIKVDNSRTLIITRVERERAPRTDERPASKATNAGDDNEIWLVILGGFVGIIVSAWVIARFAPIVSNLMLGISLGTACTALLLALRYRRSPVPLWRWAWTTVAVAVALATGRQLMNTAQYKGVRLADASAIVRDRGFSDGLQALQKEYPIEILGFLAVQMLGAVVLLLVAGLVMGRLLGVVVAVVALAGSAPRPWHAKVVSLLYPAGRFAWQLIGVTILTGMGLLLVSGIFWSKTQNLPTLPDFPSSTHTSSGSATPTLRSSAA